jgi:hypothetical protein
MGEERKVYIVLEGKPEERRPLGKPRHRWEDEFRMDDKGIGWRGVEWIPLTFDWALVNVVMNLWVLVPWT